MEEALKELKKDMEIELSDNRERINSLYAENDALQSISERIDVILKKQNTTVNKIKALIEEIENNKKIDEEKGIEASTVTCVYMLYKLKDIIK